MEAQFYRDRVLPEVGNPRERGKPRTAVIDGSGLLGFDVSGGRLENGEIDPRVDTVKEWMREYGWRPSSDRVETHVEAKIVVDMIQGRLPDHLTLVINNEICKEPDAMRGADIVSWRKFIAESLPPDHSLRGLRPQRQNGVLPRERSMTTGKPGFLQRRERGSDDHAKPETRRRRVLHPLQGVGPLTFGMTLAEVTAALGAEPNHTRHDVKQRLEQADIPGFPSLFFDPVNAWSPRSSTRSTAPRPNTTVNS